VNVSSAALASVGGDRVRVLLGLEPAWPAARAAGPALTVQGAPGDNLALHHAVAAVRPGDVLVLAVGGHRETAHCGGLVAAAAKGRGAAAIVIDGAIRDRVEIAELGLPLFHLGTSPRKPGKDGPGAVGVPVELLGARVEPGDLVAADADGIVVVPAADVEEIVAAATVLDGREHAILERLADGATTVEIYGLDPL
jgi:4-hydroxy-4-methyl-2-oxoglutarate aldolase